MYDFIFSVNAYRPRIKGDIKIKYPKPLLQRRLVKNAGKKR
jgi:hypothetical protein